MRAALALAHAAGARGEVPVGAVVVKNGIAVGEGANAREAAKDATRHAEMDAIAAACRTLGAWRLAGCTLYVTLEPCLMCAGAIYQARLDRVVFGALDPKAGAMGSLYRVHEDQRLNHRLPLTGGVLAEECGEILRDFFRARR
jgi:tRNA(adenine34) deaminase